MVARPPVLFFVHDHGSGHRRRTERVLDSLSSSAVVMTADRNWCPPVPVERLPSDVPTGDPIDPTAGGALHWAPLDPASMGRRTTAVVDALDRHRPSLVVVDVSVEIALLARLAGYRTVYVRQHGDRSDEPHQLAYRASCHLLAPWPAVLESPDTPEWMRAKTTYSSFIGCAPPTTCPDRSSAARDTVGVLWGSGGEPPTTASLGTLAAAVWPQTVDYVGPLPAGDSDGAMPPNLQVHGWVDEPMRTLRRCHTIIASAGNNAVADAAGLGAALVVIPQDRPFREQRRHAARLHDAGLAAYSSGWPIGEHSWAELLALARRRRDRLAEHGATDGSVVAAGLLDELADG